MPETLIVDDLTIGYGGVPVAHDITLRVEPGEMVAPLGPNGAGKTSTLKGMSGLLRPMAGRVTFGRCEVSTLPAHKVARLGISHVPEDRALFFGLTVRDHLALAQRTGPIEPLKVFPSLAPLLSRRAGLLSGGEQQMLAVARALAAQPSTVLIDEMSLGLAPQIVETLFNTLRNLVDRYGLGVLLVEQHVQLALQHVDRGLVLSQGRIVKAGSAAELRSQWDDIERSYLGYAS